MAGTKKTSKIKPGWVAEWFKAAVLKDYRPAPNTLKNSVSPANHAVSYSVLVAENLSPLVYLHHTRNAPAG